MQSDIGAIYILRMCVWPIVHDFHVLLERARIPKYLCKNGPILENNVGQLKPCKLLHQVIER